MHIYGPPTPRQWKPPWNLAKTDCAAHCAASPGRVKPTVSNDVPARKKYAHLSQKITGNPPSIPDQPRSCFKDKSNDGKPLVISYPKDISLNIRDSIQSEEVLLKILANITSFNKVIQSNNTTTNYALPPLPPYNHVLTTNSMCSPSYDLSPPATQYEIIQIPPSLTNPPISKSKLPIISWSYTTTILYLRFLRHG